jgi:hypothetical protein
MVSDHEKRTASEAFGTEDYFKSEKRSKGLNMQAATKWKPTLLDMPPEIRLLILKELLQPEAPLRERSQLHPAILRTCKTLANDHKNSPLLYQNTFALQIWIDAEDHTMRFLDCTITDNPYWLTTMDRPTSRAEKIAITIYIDYGSNSSLLTEDDSAMLKQSVPALIRPLSVCDCLRYLSITVINKHTLAKDNTIGNDILHGLKEIRGLECVDIQGVSPAHAADMKAVMESRVATESLFHMLVPLTRYLGEEFYDIDGWSDIVRAVGDYDVELFKKSRDDIVRRLEAARASLRQNLTSQDGLVRPFGDCNRTRAGRTWAHDHELDRLL